MPGRGREMRGLRHIWARPPKPNIIQTFSIASLCGEERSPHGESVLFPDKIDIKKVSESCGTQEISVRRHNFSTNPFHIILFLLQMGW